VKDFLSIAPQMALIPNSSGSYPLHIAILNQQCYETIFEIFKALPDMGKINDKDTGLLPYMLAAMGNWKNEMDQTTIIYQLLREDPQSIIEL